MGFEHGFEAKLLVSCSCSGKVVAGKRGSKGERVDHLKAQQIFGQYKWWVGTAQVKGRSTLRNESREVI